MLHKSRGCCKGGSSIDLQLDRLCSMAHGEGWGTGLGQRTKKVDKG